MDTIDYRGLFEGLPIPHVLMDREHRIVAMNAAYLGVTGRTRDDIIGKTMFEAFPESEERQDMLRRSIERARDEGVTDHLALIPYEIWTEVGPEMRYWSATHTPVRDKTGFVKFVLQQTQNVTELQRLRQAAGGARETQQLGSDVLRRAAAVQSLNTSLSAESDRLRGLFMQAPSFMAVLRGPEHVFEMANKACQEILGRDNLIGRAVKDAVPEVAAQGFIDLLDNVLRSGEPYIGTNAAVTLLREGREAQLYVNFVFQPITEPNGHVSGVFVEGFDVTEQVRAERRQRLLLDELNHRVKNTLATVQAIALQTLKNDGPNALSVFQERLASLSRTHATLTRDKWSGASLEELLRAELHAYGPARIALSGPQVQLKPRQALALGLVVHELSTNAAKYGAMARPEGQISTRWRVEDGKLHLNWREGGGPRAEPPTRQGFGTRLIRRTIEGEMQGEMEMNYTPEGLAVRLSIPLEAEPAEIEA
ncbi:MAG: HWE histidine kinase domain-containing protein [Hyphomonadaceae bacterium]